MTNSRIANIVIVGGGTAGWMTAAALTKILGVAHHSITLVESEQIGIVGVGEATIPMIQLYNNVLGLDEDEFVRETNATFKLGIEFVDWRRIGHRYFHPFGNLGVDMDGIGFMHFWERWNRLGGGGLDYGRFNAETEAARALRFKRTNDEAGPTTMPAINYAFQFDAALYAAYLRRFSEKRGAQRIEGKIVDVSRDAESGDITSLTLESGAEIAGDFFIDCSGFRGILIEQVFKAGYDDWSRWLPVNRAVAVPCDSSDSLLPYTRSTAREFGWQWRIPLQHRIGNGYVYCDKYISEDEAASRLLDNLDGPPQAEPRTLRFVAGRRKKVWIRNCVAFGLASGFLEPLESTSIHLIQVAIAKLLAMFPGKGFSDRLISRYNKEMAFEYDNVKDFLIAHYKLTERDDTEFWKYARGMDIPESLQEKFDVFRARGEVMARHEELFKETSWYAVLVGQGLTPEGYHPVADAISEDELRLRLTKIRTGIRSRVDGMPDHKAFIRANCRSPQASFD